MVSVDNFLAHHGVKGMKWGVRQDRGHVGERVKTKKLAKLDKKWQKNIYSVHGAVAVHNTVADKMNAQLDAFNNKPEYRNKKLLDFETGEPIGKTGKKYYDEYNKMVEKATREAVDEVHGINPSGTHKARLETKGGNWRVVVESTEVKHADQNLPTLVIDVDHDDNGMITQLAGIKEDLVQTENVDNFLAHHGVKGMKWGVRRKRKNAVEQKHSEDSAKAREAFAKAKKHGHTALSNEELRALNDRLNLEQNFSRLTAPPKKDNQLKKGQDFARQVLSVGKTVNEAVAFANSPTGQFIQKSLSSTSKPEALPIHGPKRPKAPVKFRPRPKNQNVQRLAELAKKK